MVAVIKTSGALRRPFHYNENKVKEGLAECLMVQNYPIGKDNITEEMRLKMLLKMAELNTRTTVNAVHISLNFAPGETIEKVRLQEITKEYMQGIGFGNQPYLVYKHNDAGHPHLHIVTTNIELDGKRIPLHNIGKLKSEPARKAIEKKYGLVPAEAHKKQLFTPKPVSVSKVNYGKTETKRAIGNVLQHVLNNYKFTSLPELNAVLKLYNITADRGGEGSRIFKHKGLVYRVLDESGNKTGVPIKASSFHFKPTLPAVESKFVKNELGRQKYLAGIRSAIDIALLKRHGITLDELVATIEKQGISTIIRRNNEGRLYGITYIDHRTRSVFNGSVVGKKYSAKGITERCGTSLNDTAQQVAPLSFKSQATKELEQDNPDSNKGTGGSQASTEGMIDEVITPEETYSHVPYEWRKKKKKKGKRISK
ncbi:relaxase/mobilization nuclease domain-containing protein [Algoriphagus algorifonticola]|uniref:relaxase/mobilization nuclease domain-containing protein n=1 Tax=Algoriphagus algorifonticola TaxID=2593007 RepID=UPI0011A46F9D|nr:relaxase/mobilization nuclease domain-containing protein [Algoriphagus algorifonticola]